MKEKNFNISKILYLDDRSPNEMFKKHQISVKYETEPPHGDAIYSIVIKEKLLPFWIYGRNIIFIGDTKVMVESVKCKTWSPVHSILIDLEKGMYADLMEWYTEITFFNNQIKMVNYFKEKDALILNNFDDLQWIDL
ncbi:MAG: hypothetical protein Q4D51_03140 [Eubacteriales bacterium]|nr:hypothetical protein [Eubacteriales bacterium]